MRIDDVPILNPLAATAGVLLYYKLVNDQLVYQYKINSYDYVVAQSFGLNLLALEDKLFISAHGSRDSNFTPIGAFYQIPINSDSVHLPIRYWGTANGSITTAFGENFVTNDSLLFVSASYQSDSAYWGRGCVYVYSVHPDTLIFREKVSSPLDQSRQRFGRTMALSGDRLFIAAPQDDFAFDQGRVYVYDISGDSLKLTHTITAPNSSNINFFGLHMAVLGDTLLVGAPQDSSFGWNRGGIYLFHFDENNNYRLERTISLPDSENVLQFPSSLILTKDFILAGAAEADQLRGAVYLFSKEKPVGVNDEIEESFNYRLYDNYPNPFNNQTKIQYHVGKAGQIKLSIYDVLGRELEVLKDEFHQQGSYQAEFDGTRYSSGVYFYSLEAADTRIVKKLVLMK